MATYINNRASENSQTCGVQTGKTIVFTLLAFLLAATHFVFLMMYFEPAISTPDANSYFGQAKLIAKNARTYFEPESIVQYIGFHWHRTRDNRYYVEHPPGFSSILAVVYKIFGPKASLLVNPVMASLSLLALFLLCRLWVGQGWALLAMALMAFNPFANEHALFGDAHTPVVFLLLVALLLIARWTKTHSARLALAVGFLFGTIATIRYVEILFCLAIGIFILLHFRPDKVFWHSPIAFAVGVAIPVCALCIRNQVAFGAFWKTGYEYAFDEFNASATFGGRFFANHYLPFLRMLMSEGCGLIFGLGVAGITIMCTRRDRWKQGLLFAMLVVPVTILYMSLFWPPDQQSMRYLLPTFYIYTIAAVWLLQLAAGDSRLSAWASSIVLLIITILWGLQPSLRSMEHLRDQSAVLAKITSAVERSVEPGSILIANEAINQHLDFIGRWRLADGAILNLPEPLPPGLLAIKRNIRPRRLPRNNEARTKYSGLENQELFDAFSQDVWQWASKNRKVYWVASEEEVENFKQEFPAQDKLTTIAKIELPAARLTRADMPIGFREQTRPVEGPMTQRKPSAGPTLRPPEPQGPNRIFDLILDGEPLLLVEWTREIQ
jgi:4-amino-4-deoxy-L-arabinose transferase-like glycosyltransferase